MHPGAPDPNMNAATSRSACVSGNVAGGPRRKALWKGRWTEQHSEEVSKIVEDLATVYPLSRVEAVKAMRSTKSIDRAAGCCAKMPRPWHDMNDATYTRVLHGKVDPVACNKN